MTPTTTISTIAYHELKSIPPTDTVKVAPSRPLQKPATRARDSRRAEVAAWLTQQLDWEHRLDHLRDRHAEHTSARLRP